MKSPIFKVVLEREKRFGVDVSDISVYICLIDIRSKSKEQLNERRAGLSKPGFHSMIMSSTTSCFNFFLLILNGVDMYNPALGIRCLGGGITFDPQFAEP